MKKFFDAFGLGGGLLILVIMTFSLVWWIGEIGDFLLKYQRLLLTNTIAYGIIKAYNTTTIKD